MDAKAIGQRMLERARTSGRHVTRQDCKGFATRVLGSTVYFTPDAGAGPEWKANLQELVDAAEIFEERRLNDGWVQPVQLPRGSMTNSYKHTLYCEVAELEAFDPPVDTNKKPVRTGNSSGEEVADRTARPQPPPFCFLCHGQVGSQLSYPNMVCRACDGRALSLEGSKPLHATDRVLDPSRPAFYKERGPEGQRRMVANVDVGGDYGTNPIFIDGKQCWRRYRFGGWVTMADPENHTTLEDFYAHHNGTGPDRDCPIGAVPR